MNIQSNILKQASTHWLNRPADERFTSLQAMLDHFRALQERSRATSTSTRRIEAQPAGDGVKGLTIVTDKADVPLDPTHWSFGQVAQLSGAPPAYLRKLPSPIAADCINYGLQYGRSIEDIGLLYSTDETGRGELRAATGPQYGRVWNSQIVKMFIDRFGDGVTGDWCVPGVNGASLDTVTKQNTTMFASDRDMFVFLADQKNKVELPGRRNGETGLLSRGFFFWNSEVGKTSLGMSTFYFDHMCANRWVMGAQGFKEIRIRHTSGAPERWLDEVMPAVQAYANSPTSSIVDAIEHAKASRVDDVDEFLSKRFTAQKSKAWQALHEAEEGRPIESLWDVGTAMTAAARSIENQDQRVELEREAGKVLALAA